jgi:PAS domain S-box-containing protein
LTLKPVKNETGEVNGLVFSLVETTERKRAEEKLLQIQDRLSVATEAAKIGIHDYDIVANSVQWDERIREIWGVEPDEPVTYETFIENVHPNDRAAVQAEMDKALDPKRGAFYAEYRVVNRKDKMVRWVYATGKTFFDDNRTAVRLIGTAEDITERKKVEEELKKSEERYRSYIEVTGELGWTTNPEGGVIEDLPSWRNFTGQTFDEIKGSGWSKALHPDDLENTLRAWKQAIRDKSKYEVEYRMRRHDGVYRRFMARGVPVLNDDGSLREWVGTSIDITERKKAEEALTQQAQLLHLSYDAIIVWRKDGGIEHWNRGAEQLYGYTESEALGRATHKLLKTIHPMPWLEIEAAMRKHGQWEGEIRHYAKDGHEVTVSARHQLVLGTDGIERILETNRDITERKKAEKVLLKQAALIDLSPDGVVVKNFDDTVTFWSKGAEKLYGWTKEEAVGRKIIDLLKPVYPHASSLGDVLKKVKVDGKWAGQFVHHAKDGHEIIVMSSWLAMDNKSGGMEILESNTDITEQMRLQSKLEEKAKEVEEYANSMEALAQNRLLQLRDAERLAAIGQTAGMVGHDIRNPLQSILGELYLAKTELSRIHEQDVKNNLAESITNIEKDIYYINKIVEDLQDFAKPIKPVFQEINLEDVCEAVLLKAKIPEKITASCCVEKETKLIVTDPDMLRRVVRNLVNNAMQAMPQGGKLDIRAFKDADDLEMTIEDTGVGISEEAKSKLFTPLFTTKSKGQGFGLAVVKRMTEALGGTVTFESEEGEGTKFILRFPSTKSGGN